MKLMKTKLFAILFSQLFVCCAPTKKDLNNKFEWINLDKIELVENLICDHIDSVKWDSTALKEFRIPDSVKYILDKKTFASLSVSGQNKLKKCADKNGMTIGDVQFDKNVRLNFHGLFFSALASKHNDSATISFGKYFSNGFLTAGYAWNYRLLKNENKYFVDLASKKIRWEK